MGERDDETRNASPSDFLLLSSLFSSESLLPFGFRTFLHLTEARSSPFRRIRRNRFLLTLFSKVRTGFPKTKCFYQCFLVKRSYFWLKYEYVSFHRIEINVSNLQMRKRWVARGHHFIFFCHQKTVQDLRFHRNRMNHTTCYIYSEDAIRLEPKRYPPMSNPKTLRK